MLTKDTSAQCVCQVYTTILKHIAVSNSKSINFTLTFSLQIVQRNLLYLHLARQQCQGGLNLFQTLQMNVPDSQHKLTCAALVTSTTATVERYHK